MDQIDHEVTIVLNVSIYKKAKMLLSWIKRENAIALLQPGVIERTEYSRKRKPKKRGPSKGPKAPKRQKSRPTDYGAIDIKIDLESAIRERNTREVTRLYYQLARLLSWET